MISTQAHATTCVDVSATRASFATTSGEGGGRGGVPTRPANSNTQRKKTQTTKKTFATEGCQLSSDRSMQQEGLMLPAFICQIHTTGGQTRTNVAAEGFVRQED